MKLPLLKCSSLLFTCFLLVISSCKKNSNRIEGELNVEFHTSSYSCNKYSLKDLTSLNIVADLLPHLSEEIKDTLNSRKVTNLQEYLFHLISLKSSLSELKHINISQINSVFNGSDGWIPNYDSIKYYISKDNLIKSDIKRVKNVHSGFQEWANIPGIGLKFCRVSTKDSANVFITFDKKAKNCASLDLQYSSRYKFGLGINFANDVSLDTNYHLILHEIGHILGLYHEHQHPTDLIKFDTALIASRCSHMDYMNQIINPIQNSTVISSDYWDSLSVMNYEFLPGEITNRKYCKNGLRLRGELSQGDKNAIRDRYPSMCTQEAKDILVGDTINLDTIKGKIYVFEFKPDTTCEYSIETIGNLPIGSILIYQKTNDECTRICNKCRGGEEKQKLIMLNLNKDKTYQIVCIRSSFRYNIIASLTINKNKKCQVKK